jgi:hypothetical protein
LGWPGGKRPDRREPEKLAKKLRRHGRRWFAFLLCRTCNTGFGLDVDRLLAEVPAELFEQWWELYAAEPWDAERTDLAFGELIAHVNTTHGVEAKAPRDYMPLLKKATGKRQSQGEMQRTWETVCLLMEERVRKNQGVRSRAPNS